MFRRIDLLLLGITVVLVLFGLAMIASVSVFESYQITKQLVSQGVRDTTSNSFYLWRSFIHVVIGFSILGFIAVVPYRLWEVLALPLFVATIALLIAVFMPGISVDYGTAHSWLRIGPFSLQIIFPSSSG